MQPFRMFLLMIPLLLPSYFSVADHSDHDLPEVQVMDFDSFEPRDSYTKMIERAEEKNFPFAYLVDADQEVYPQYGATRTPHVFLLEKEGDDFVVAYIGTIDDNYRDADAVEEPFLANAIDALLAGDKPDPDYTRAIGCTIKVRDEE